MSGPAGPGGGAVLHQSGPSGGSADLLEEGCEPNSLQHQPDPRYVAAVLAIVAACRRSGQSGRVAADI